MKQFKPCKHCKEQTEHYPDKESLLMNVDWMCNKCKTHYEYPDGIHVEPSLRKILLIENNRIIGMFDYLYNDCGEKIKVDCLEQTHLF